MQGFQAVPELIRRSGVPVVFSMLGGTNVPWIAEGVRAGAFRFVRTRHEATAVAAATGFSRASGQVGLCTVTRGPGFANAINALKAATYDHVPVVLIVSESPPTHAKVSPHYQSIDQQGLTTIIGAGFHHAARPDELSDAFWSAFSAAQWNGLPQVLSIADRMMDADMPLGETAIGRPPVETPDREAVVAAVDALERAERPLVLAGQGALLSDCRTDLETLADLVGARLASTLNVNRFFSGHPRDLGVCGQSSPAVVLEELQKTDVVLAVGASLNNYTTGSGTIFAGATIIQCEIDIERPLMASSPELGLLGNARETVQALIEEWQGRGLELRPVVGRIPAMEAIRTAVLDVDLGHDPVRGLDLRRVYTSFDRKLPRDRIVVTDSGRFAATMPTLVDAEDARSWLGSRGYGSIGLGLGVAVGAAAAQPERNVVLFCGDGGFMMSAQDLDAVRLNQLNLTIVIMNDEQYGSERPYLELYRLPSDVVRQDLPDVVALARAFGGDAAVVRTEDDLAKLELPASGLFLVDVRIDPEVNGRAAIGG
jgi:acetolactate synthase-1/2/3 large subunit